MADFRSVQRVRLYDGSNDIGFAAGNPLYISISDGTETALVDASGNLQVGGTVAATQSGTWNINTVTTLTGITNDVNIADGGNSITIDDGGLSLTVDASQLDIDDLNEATDNVRIYANTAKDGSGTAYVPLVDADGHLQVDILSGATAASKTDDSAFTVGTDDVAPMGALADDTTPDSVDEGDVGIPRMTLDRKLLVRIVGATDANRVDVDGSGNIKAILAVNDGVDIGDVTINNASLTVAQGTPDNLNANANIQVGDTDVSQTNPVPVQIVSTTVSASEVHDYDQATSVAKNGTDNHDYTVANTTFLLKSVIVAASGAGKYEIQAGPLASLVTVAVVFTSGSDLTKQVVFDPPVEVPVTSTGTVRVIRRNDDNSTMDMYSTIVGNDV